MTGWDEATPLTSSLRRSRRFQGLVGIGGADVGKRTIVRFAPGFFFELLFFFLLFRKLFLTLLVTVVGCSQDNPSMVGAHSSRHRRAGWRVQRRGLVAISDLVLYKNLPFSAYTVCGRSYYFYSILCTLQTLLGFCAAWAWRSQGAWPRAAVMDRVQRRASRFRR